MSFAGALNCSRGARPALELLHLSKAGGTSMCQLAAASGLKNPAATINANCLVPHLAGEPKWTRLQPGQDARMVWPAADCPRWVMEKEVSCQERWVFTLTHQIASPYYLG